MKQIIDGRTHFPSMFTTAEEEKDEDIREYRDLIVACLVYAVENKEDLQ
jgi:hypothetical protein